MTGNGKLLVWIAVALGAAAGVAVTVVLLRGDPTYLVQARTRAGAPYGAPAPVNFAFRAFSATVLAAGLIAAGGRAVSEEALPLWPATLAGYALFVLAGDRVGGGRAGLPDVLDRRVVRPATRRHRLLRGDRGPSPGAALAALGILPTRAGSAGFVVGVCHGPRLIGRASLSRHLFCTLPHRAEPQTVAHGSGTVFGALTGVSLGYFPRAGRDFPRPPQSESVPARSGREESSDPDLVPGRDTFTEVSC